MLDQTILNHTTPLKETVEGEEKEKIEQEEVKFKYEKEERRRKIWFDYLNGHPNL